MTILVLIDIARLSILFVAAVGLAKGALDVMTSHSASYFLANDGAALFAAAELIAAAVISYSDNGWPLIA